MIAHSWRCIQSVDSDLALIEILTINFFFKYYFNAILIPFNTFNRFRVKLLKTQTLFRRLSGGFIEINRMKLKLRGHLT